MARRRYSIEFKQEAVGLVLDSGMSVANAAKDLGVGWSTLDKWVRSERIRRQDPNALSESDMAKLKRLEKENHELRLEREILKKAAVFFAKASK